MKKKYRKLPRGAIDTILEWGTPQRVLAPDEIVEDEELICNYPNDEKTLDTVYEIVIKGGWIPRIMKVRRKIVLEKIH